MATHSSTLAWRIPWMEEPGGLQSMGHKENVLFQLVNLEGRFQMELRLPISCLSSREL